MDDDAQQPQQPQELSAIRQNLGLLSSLPQYNTPGMKSIRISHILNLLERANLHHHDYLLPLVSELMLLIDGPIPATFVHNQIYKFSLTRDELRQQMRHAWAQHLHYAWGEPHNHEQFH